jgi:hypothetical protein
MITSNHRVLLVLLLLLAGASASAFAASSQGEISYLEGKVSIDNVPAAIGDRVPLGATVRTDASSLCEIVFREKNIIRLGDQTTFVFNPSNLQVGSDLQKGALTLVLKNLVNGAAGDHSFFVRTPTAAAGVRGTSFFMKVESADTTYICMCNGAARIDGGPDPAGLDLESSHHAAYRLSTDQAGTPTVSTAPLLYHDDEDMEGLAAKIGVSIDWSRVDRSQGVGRSSGN